MATYSTNSDGKFIPASQRPDGTWRKARRVKDGYVPQEEVPLYESKGKQFANKTSEVPVVVCPFAGETYREKREKQKKNKQNNSSTPGLLVLSSNNKNIQKKNKTPNNKHKNSSEAAATGTDENDIEIITDDIAENLIVDEKLENAKKLKRLRKKMREIETIETKLNTGELKNPEKDQLDKVKKKKQILKEISELEIIEIEP